MPPLLRLIWARVQMLGHSVVGLRRGGALKFVVVLGFGVVLVGVLFSSMSYGFGLLQHYPEFQNVLVGYLFSIYFLTMLLMLTFSNAVISFGALFRSPETRLLMTLPLEPQTVYNYKAGESLIFSSWAFMFLGGPLLMAFGLYGTMERVGASFYLAAAALMLPFVFIPAAAGAIIGMLLTRYFPRTRGKVLGLGFALLAAVGLGLSVRAGFFKHGATIDEAFLEDIFATFRFCQSPWVPSFWIAEGMLSAAGGEWSTVAFYGALLCSTAIFLWALGDFLAEKIYPSSYSRASGAPARRLYRAGGAVDWASGKLARLAPVTTRLVVKDLRNFLRDPVQWSQVVIFFGLLFLYVANLRNLGYQAVVLEHIKSLRWTNFVAFTNLAAAGLTLATLTTRFVFPLVSMEGRRFWVLGLLPVRRSRILLGKYVFSLGGSLVLLVPLVLLSGYMLGSPREMTGLYMVAALALCLGLPGIAVGMGAVFPNYREESPAKVVSGFGGTLCLVLSVGFVGLLVMGVGLLSRQHVLAQEGVRAMRRPLLLANLLAAALAAAAAGLPLALGCRAINRAEL